MTKEQTIDALDLVKRLTAIIDEELLPAAAGIVIHDLRRLNESLIDATKFIRDNQKTAYGALIPSAFWDDEEAESCHTSINDVLNERNSWDALKVGDEVHIGRYTTLPSIIIRITAVEGDEVAWAWEEIDQ